MRSYTAHLSGARAPVLVREGFAWGAVVFGPFWLARHRAWAALVVAVSVGAAIAARVPAPLSGWLLLLLAATLGVFGNDLRRGALARRGFVEAHVVVARDAEAAYARLLAACPELLGMAAQ